MRKLFIATTALLIITLIISSYAYYKVNTLGEELRTAITNLERDIKNEDWQQAITQGNILADKWRQTNQTWTMLMDHREIDRLDLKIEEIQKLIELKEQDKLLTKLTLARKLSIQIPENERPVAKNIF